MDMETLAYLKSLFDSAGGLKSVGEALDIGKKAKDLLRGSGGQPSAKETELRELIVDLQEKLLDARQQTIDLRHRFLALVEQAESASVFEAEKDNYQLVELSRNSRAYIRKDPAAEGVSGPEYCAICFDQRRKRVMLQRIKTLTGSDVLRCSECGGEVFKPNGLQGLRRRVISNPNRDW